MVIIGAKGHAKEILELFTKKNQLDDLFFFDNVSNDLPKFFYKKFQIIRDFQHLKEVFKKDKKFVIGVGNPKTRYILAKSFIEVGGQLTSIISEDASIGSWNCKIEDGVNVMSNVFISNDVQISEGVLLNTGCNIHHDVKIGMYSEISPKAVLLGKVELGNQTFIGANATILPNIKIGSNVIVGAGAVVIKDVGSNKVIAGNPSRIIKNSK